MALWEVLRDEYNTLHTSGAGDPQVDEGECSCGLKPWRFREDDIKDFDALICRIHDSRSVEPAHQLSQEIWDLLDKKSGHVLGVEYVTRHCPIGKAPVELEVDEPRAARLKAMLLEVLNDLLEKPDLYSRWFRNQDIPMSPTLSRLMEEHTENGVLQFNGIDLCCVNRLLLERAYPQELGRIDEVRLKEIYSKIDKECHAALCLSGGGIRSASFGLGVLQALARVGLLQKFEYLSTVSGGGYIGGWLAVWSTRHQKGMRGVIAELGATSRSSSNVEPGPVRHLRHYSNYLTPKLGFFSADTWTVVATYLRNLLVNWSFLTPILLSVLLAPRIYGALAREVPSWTVTLLVKVVGFVLGVLAVLYRFLSRPSAAGFRKEARFRFLQLGEDQRTYLMWSASPLLLSAILLSFCHVWPLPANDRKQPSPLLEQVAGSPLPSATIYPDLTGDVPLVPASYRFFVLPTGSPSLNPDRSRSQTKESEPGKRLTVFRLTKSEVAFFPALILVAWIFHALLLYRFDLRRYNFGELGQAVLSGALGGISVWIMAEIIHCVLAGSWAKSWLPNIRAGDIYVLIAVPLFLSAFFFAESLFVALRSGCGLAEPEGDCETSGLEQENDREWWARSGAWTLIMSFTWIVVTSVAFVGPLLLLKIPAIIAPLGGLSGLFSILYGKSHGASSGKGRSDGWQSFLLDRALLVAGFVFLLILLSMLSFAGSWLLCQASQAGLIVELSVEKWLKWISSVPLCGPNSLNYYYMWHSGQDVFIDPVIHLLALNFSPYWLPLSLVVGLLLLGLLIDRYIDFNRFSLHSLYKYRLIRAYLGASNTTRRPNPFTGFDANDNVSMHTLHQAEKRQSPTSEETCLFPVVNTTLNLVKGSSLAWQQRKAEPFTVTPLHAGNRLLGYRRVAYRDHDNPHRTYYGGNRGISLGTAMTISGAAASPNMGYHSSPLITFLLALFNLRLGCWLGNTGTAGEKSFDRHAPAYGSWYLIAEALGLTDDKNPFVYLSDGGHFDNLGLYEMVLRRCRFIVAVDASCDPDRSLEDLGNTISKIRIDLGVSIEFPPGLIPQSEREKHVQTIWIGKIDYPDIGSGTLIYVKPDVTGDEPADVLHYRTANPRFPHETTVDQWFSESQFESYRMLGYHIIRSVQDDVWEVLREKGS